MGEERGEGKPSKIDIKGHVHSGSEVGGFIFSREMGDLQDFGWALEQISSSDQLYHHSYQSCPVTVDGARWSY